jgi:hypothetical protein
MGYEISQESTEPKGYPPKQHADTLAGAIEPQIVIDFAHPPKTLDLTQRRRGHFGSRRRLRWIGFGLRPFVEEILGGMRLTLEGQHQAKLFAEPL